MLRNGVVALVIALVMTFLTPVVVSAGDSQDVSVAARPYIAGSPIGFQLIYITDTNILIQWTKGVDADNTMVRAKYGSYPTDIEDGYLVYMGPDSQCNDTALNLDETASDIYYRAWSESGGIWYEYEYGEDFIGGNWMTLIAFLLVALVPTIAAYVMKRTMFAIMGMGGWLFVGVYAYQQVDTHGTLYYGLFIFCMGMMFMSAIEMMFIRSKKTDTQPFLDPDYEQPDDEELAQHRQQKRMRQQKMYARTGKPMSDERRTKIRMRSDGKRVNRNNERILRKQVNG